MIKPKEDTQNFLVINEAKPTESKVLSSVWFVIVWSILNSCINLFFSEW